MTVYLYRVQYTDADGLLAYEPIAVRNADDDESVARAEVVAATQRYPAAIGGSATVTLISTMEE